MNKKHRIAAIAGDGIGTETLPEGLRVLEAAASRFGIDLAIDHFDFASWQYYERHGSMRLVKQGKTATLGKYYASDIPAFGARSWVMTVASVRLAIRNERVRWKFMPNYRNAHSTSVALCKREPTSGAPEGPSQRDVVSRFTNDSGPASGSSA